MLQRPPGGAFGEPVATGAGGSAFDAAVAPAGGGAVAYETLSRVRVFVADAQGKVLTSRTLPAALGAREFADVYADSRGTSAVWREGTAERLLATRTR